MAIGPGLDRECRSLAPIAPGQVYGVDEPSDRLLADCYRNALALAEKHGIRSIAFPALSTGVFGYPMEAAARAAVAAVLDAIPR